MLTLRLHMSFFPEAAGEAAAVMRSLVGPVRAEPGCIATRLLRGTGKDSSLTWIEDWRNIDYFKEHLREDTFRQIVAVMELAASRPQIEIDDVTARRGFDLVEEILGMAAGAASHSARDGHGRALEEP